MAKYTSGRQKNLKVGIVSYSENLTSIEVVGKVGIGTTDAGGRSLYVNGNAYISQNLDVSGVSTIGNFRITPVGSGATVGGIGITYYGDGSNLTGTILNTVQNIDNNQIYYPLLSPTISGTISSISVSSDSIVFNPGTNSLGIGSTQPNARLDVIGDAKVSGILTAANILPPTDNTGVVGNTAFTWSNGQFTNLTINDTLTVRAAIDLSDGDILQFGATDDIKVFYDGTANDLEIELEAAANQIAITDNGTYRVVIKKDGSVGIGTTNPTQKLQVDGNTLITGQFQSTQANSTATGGGQIYLNGATGNRIDFNTNGVAAPAFTTRSAGTKIVLYPDISASKVDYALGIEAETLWYSIASAISTRQFRWYGGTTQLVDLKGSGELVIGSSTLTGTASQKLQVNSGGYFNGSVGIGTTNPEKPLHLSTSVATPLIIQRTTTNNSAAEYRNTTASMWAGLASNATGWGVGATADLSSDAQILVTRTGGELLVGSLSATGTASQRLQVTGGAYVSGNLGVGTTNPTQTLHVQGNARVTGAVYDSTNLPGTSGQILQSTVSGTQWINVSALPGAFNGLTILDEGTPIGAVGSVTQLDFVGDIVSVASTAGIATITISSNYVSNAGFATYANTAGVATALQNARTFEITGDVVASPIIFDGTGNVSLAATIQPNSVALGSDTTGDYVQSITGTSNQITVTSGTGEGSTPILSLPNQVTIPQDLTVLRDVQIDRNLNVNGNITIGGTSAAIFAQELKIFDPDIVLGVRTDAFGNDVSTDNTANHGGVALASTEGTPLVQLFIAGIETNPATYKKIMWFKAGEFAGLGTDAWLANYAVGIGSTQFPTGTRLAAGSVQITENDLAVVRNINASGITTTNNLNVTGVGTFLSSGLKIRNPANTFGYTITGGAIAADRILNLPVITGTDTLATLGLSQTFSNTVTFSSTLTASTAFNCNATTSGFTVNNLTSGALTLGGPSQTSTHTFGQSTLTHTTNIQAGATASGNIKTINLGTGGLSGSFTNINVGPTAGVGTITINSATNLGINSTRPTSKLDVVGDVKVIGVVTATSFSGNASSATYATAAGIATYATNAGIATNLKGGLVGNIPYQSAADTTVFLVNGSSGTILQSNGVGNAPTWVSAAPAGAITGLTIRDEGTIVGSASSVSTLNFVGAIVSAASTAGIATITFLDYVSNAGVATYATSSGVSTSVIGGIGSITQLQVTGVSTFTNGPVFIGAATSTGTALQRLQVTDGAYVSGNLGIGTTNPTSKLHIIGDTFVSGVITSTDYNSASDINLKENVKLIENPVDKVAQLNGVTFDWKENKKSSMGVIAQDVEKVIPELVSTGDVKTVNYNGLIGLLIEVVKEQQKEIDYLKSKIG